MQQKFDGSDEDLFKTVSVNTRLTVSSAVINCILRNSKLLIGEIETVIRHVAIIVPDQKTVEIQNESRPFTFCSKHTDL